MATCSFKKLTLLTCHIGPKALLFTTVYTLYSVEVAGYTVSLYG